MLLANMRQPFVRAWRRRESLSAVIFAKPSRGYHFVFNRVERPVMPAIFCSGFFSDHSRH